MHDAIAGKVKTNGTVSCNTLRHLTHLGFIKDTIKECLKFTGGVVINLDD